MTFPNFSSKHDQESMIHPEDFLRYLREIGRLPSASPPEGIILCYQRRLYDHIVATHQVSNADGFLSDLLFLEETGGRVGVMGRFGIGAPAAVTVLEELIAWGVRKFISVGTAGTLQDDINIGDLIVCSQAIRDEGASHHYLPPSKYAAASPSMTARIESSLKTLGRSYRTGTSWTIDTPYRETVAEARRYKDEGVATVEMEAAALFTVAAYRKVELGALLTVSDSLAGLKWQPEFHAPRTQQGLEDIYQVALHSLLD
jgi:uridine phosphorylase